MGLLDFVKKAGSGIVHGIDQMAYNSAGGGLLAQGMPQQPTTGLLAPTQYDDEGNPIAQASPIAPATPPKWQPTPEQRNNMRAQFLEAIGSAVAGNKPLGQGLQEYRHGVQNDVLTARALQQQQAQQQAKQQAMAGIFAPQQQAQVHGSSDDPGMPMQPGMPGMGGQPAALGGTNDAAINSDINVKLSKIAQAAALGFMKPEEANAAREALEKTRPAVKKIHGENVRMDANGQPVVVKIFEDGTEVPSSFKPEAEFADIDIGGQVLRVDKRTNQVVSTIQKTLTPKEVEDQDKPGDPFQFFIKKYAEGLKKTPDTLTPAESNAALGKFREVNADPELRGSLLAQRRLAEAQRQLTMSQLPTQDQADAVAADIVHHRLAPDQLAQVLGRDTNGTYRRMVYAGAKKLQPDFDFEQSAADFNLSKQPGFQQTVRYMDYAKDSMGELRNVAQQLGNGDFRGINSISNMVKNAGNNTTLKRFQTVRLDAADAVAKVLQGGGSGSGTSDAKLAQAAAIFKDSDSVAAIQAAADETEKLMGLRRSTLTKGTTLDSNRSGVGAPPAAVQPTASGWKVIGVK